MPSRGRITRPLRFEQGGWHLEFEAVPTPAAWRGVPGRTIGSETAGFAVEVTDDEALRKSLKNKATRYGDPHAPYVIAVNEHSWSPVDTEDHRKNALYGTEGVVIGGPHNGLRVRDRDGLWRQGPTWRNKRVSGVLLVAHLQPWNALKAVPELGLNPMATYADVPALAHWSVRRCVVDEGLGRLVPQEPLASPSAFWESSDA